MEKYLNIQILVKRIYKKYIKKEIKMEAKDTKIIIGLTIEEVEERKRKNLVNYDTSVQLRA